MRERGKVAHKPCLLMTTASVATGTDMPVALLSRGAVIMYLYA